MCPGNRYAKVREFGLLYRRERAKIKRIGMRRRRLKTLAVGHLVVVVVAPVLYTHRRPPLFACDARPSRVHHSPVYSRPFIYYTRPYLSRTHFLLALSHAHTLLSLSLLLPLSLPGPRPLCHDSSSLFFWCARKRKRTHTHTHARAIGNIL